MYDCRVIMGFYYFTVMNLGSLLTTGWNSPQEWATLDDSD